MFNQILKERYIEESAPSNISKLNKIFKVSESYEIKYETDLYNFSLEQLQQLYTEIDDSKENIMLIKNYIDWSIEMGLRWGNANPLA